MFLKNDNTLWTTGCNTYGQLGDGTTTDSATPIRIAADVTVIAAGGDYSMYLTADNTLWATGRNSISRQDR